MAAFWRVHARRIGALFALYFCGRRSLSRVLELIVLAAAANSWGRENLGLDDRPVDDHWGNLSDLLYQKRVVLARNHIATYNLMQISDPCRGRHKGLKRVPDRVRRESDHDSSSGVTGGLAGRLRMGNLDVRGVVKRAIRVEPCPLVVRRE